MKTRLTLRPGQNGTKKLIAKYGEKLLSVRYRYDSTTQRRYKTVELIEEELPWNTIKAIKYRADDLVEIRIDYSEGELRKQVKGAGAVWRPERKLWSARYAVVQGLGLEGRIVV